MHLSHASLDMLCPNWRTEAAVVLERDQVQACSPAAAREGVRAGMRVAGVNTLCPHATLAQYDAHTAARAIGEVSLALLQYTPEVALCGNDTLLLDVSASLSLFGGARRLLRKVQATLAALGFAARVSMAPTAGGAWLLATFIAARRRRVLRLAALARLLDALPCAALPAAQPYLDWLEGIGGATLGALRALPRAGLQRRTHKSILQALDAAYGQAPELFEWIVPPPQFAGRVELMERLEYADAVQFVARRLIEQLCGWLAAHKRAVTRVILTLEHERGRHARPPTGLELALGAPTWEAGHLLRLLKERLHNLELAAPIIAVALHAADTETMAPVPKDLFPEPGGSPADRERVLELLVARLGRENLLHPSPIADHRPEVANGWVPIDQKPAPARCVQGAERPFWLLAAPIPLPVRQHRPFYGSPLRIVRGPERIEDGWWNGLAVRDYFIAQAADGARYWLYQERGGQSGWFLHGLFA
ncbi:protein ImuB [Pollutimonas bauzanensis]|uniref:Protein ImuB n=1 Tax=Pollutimonas bauzanensis TaxID=658167 RepID=A0A1M5MRG3_9BURK|nr:protein ImuB [Pollutimonas bauzanensis]